MQQSVGILCLVDQFSEGLIQKVRVNIISCERSHLLRNLTQRNKKYQSNCCFGYISDTFPEYSVS